MDQVRDMLDNAAERLTNTEPSMSTSSTLIFVFQATMADVKDIAQLATTANMMPLAILNGLTGKSRR
ncbi:MAG: hypothetical protein LQ344_000152 [Seirophora lacunosa]|nr:MAG: hypothetical protein LQ344_000152 [Seirophora lacunosa]